MLKQRLILTGFLLALVVPLKAGAQMGPPEHGTDRQGKDVRSFAAARWQVCSSSCASQKQCRAYTFVAGSGGGTCWLKEGITPARPNSKAVSGVKLMGAIERGFNRQGGDLAAGVSSEDPPACLRACQGDPRCQAWTWVKPKGKGQGVCWLKGTSPAAVNDDCCFSGIRFAGGVRHVDRRVSSRSEPSDPAIVASRTKLGRNGAPRLKSPKHTGQTGLDGGIDGQKRTESTVVLPGQDQSSGDMEEEETLQVQPSDIGITLHKLPVVTGVDDRGPQEQTAMPKSATLPRRANVLTDLLPTPRGELLASIAAMPGGVKLLDSIGVPSPSPNTTGAGPQAGLHAPTLKPDTPLDELLLGGVRLYASGKIEPAGFDPKEPPLFYETFRGWGDSRQAPPGEERLPIRSLAEDDVALQEWDTLNKRYWWNTTNGEMLRLGIRTPGKKSSTRSYILELDFRGLGEFVCYHQLMWHFAGWGVDWVPTNKGTLTAIVTLEGDRTYEFKFHRTQKEGFDREFRWFSVTML